jgi:hypothetical protein
MNRSILETLAAFSIAVLLTDCLVSAQAEATDLRPVAVEKDGVVGIEYRSGNTLVGRSTEAAPESVCAQRRRAPFSRGAPQPVTSKRLMLFFSLDSAIRF